MFTSFFENPCNGTLSSRWGENGLESLCFVIVDNFLDLSRNCSGLERHNSDWCMTDQAIDRHRNKGYASIHCKHHLLYNKCNTAYPELAACINDTVRTQIPSCTPPSTTPETTDVLSTTSTLSTTTAAADIVSSDNKFLLATVVTLSVAIILIGAGCTMWNRHLRKQNALLKGSQHSDHGSVGFTALRQNSPSNKNPRRSAVA